MESYSEEKEKLLRRWGKEEEAKPKPPVKKGWWDTIKGWFGISNTSFIGDNDI